MKKQTLTVTFFEHPDKDHSSQTTRSQSYSVEMDTPNTNNLDKEKQAFIQAFVRQHARKAAYERVTWAQKRKLSVDFDIHDANSGTPTIRKKAFSGDALLKNPSTGINQRKWQELHFTETTTPRINTLKTDAYNLKIAGSTGISISFIGAIFGGILMYALVSGSAGNYTLAAMGALLVLSVTLSLISACVEASASRLERNAREIAPALPSVSVSKISLLNTHPIVIAVPVNDQKRSCKMSKVY